MEQPNKPNDKPVKTGDIIKITIEEEGQKGDGISRIQNYVIITKNAQLKYTYEIKITATYATYAFGRIIRKIEGRSATEIMKEIENKEE